MVSKAHHVGEPVDFGGDGKRYIGMIDTRQARESDVVVKHKTKGEG